MGLNEPFTPVPDDAFDARWMAWRAKGRAQDARWRSYAIVVALLLGGSLVIALAGVIYVG